MNTKPQGWSLTELKDGTVKVMGTWLSTWRMNSGIESVSQDDKAFYFHGYSGSVYECDKKKYGVNSYGIHILQQCSLEPMTEEQAIEWAEDACNAETK